MNARALSVRSMHRNGDGCDQRGEARRGEARQCTAARRGEARRERRVDEADAHSVGSHYSVRGRVCTAMAGLIEVASASAHECAAARFAKYMAFDGRICHSATRRGNVSATECALPPARRPAVLARTHAAMCVPCRALQSHGHSSGAACRVAEHTASGRRRAAWWVRRTIAIVCHPVQCIARRSADMQCI